MIQGFLCTKIKLKNYSIKVPAISGYLKKERTNFV